MQFRRMGVPTSPSQVEKDGAELLLDRQHFKYVMGIWHGSRPVHLKYMVDFSLDRMEALEAHTMASSCFNNVRLWW